MEQITNTWNDMSLYMKIAVGVLILLVSYFIYSKFQHGQMEGMRGMSMGGQEDGGQVVCTMYYTDACPHCIKAKPEWQKFEDQYNGQIFNGKKILIVKINCEQQPDVAEKEKINGFPTFKFAFNGKTFDYNDERVLDNFVNFLQRITSSQ